VDDREAFDHITHRQVDKEQYGFGLAEPVTAAWNRVDRWLRPVQRLVQKVALPADSLTKRLRRERASSG
jgi:hypothetical protein